ncbi:MULTISPECIES: glycosyltransferase [Nocardia]|uniref:glycosyltransferase n=1 Tax=Nocardia TaxID=1817 RepID=UPI001359E273|nr:MULTISPECIES: glycosyltransferase [Nocardia]MBF6206643.1 glycosyltransferase family 1 protein [Streptomyces gardneri]
MRVALLPAGTRGDHQPYLALAHEFRTRGHEVEITATRNQAHILRNADFEPHVIPFDAAELLETTEAKRALASGKTLPFVRIMLDTVKIIEGSRGVAMHEVLVKACAAADVVVACASTLPWAMDFREKTGTPVIGCLPYPLERTDEFPSSFMAKNMTSSRFLSRASYSLFELSYTFLYRKVDRRMRREMGLPGKPRNPFRRLRDERIPLVHMVSPVLLPKPHDWSERATIVGASILPPRLRDAWGEAVVDPRLDAWLDEGPPPIYFCMTGMPVLDPVECRAMIATVCARLGTRALLTVKGEGFPKGFSADRTLLVIDSFDYDRVLPRCSAVVHHGGSGNTHDVVRAGIPAVVIPVHSDQFFYGWRIAALGIGATFPYREITTERLYQALAQALAPRARQRAAEIGRTVAQENGVLAAVDAVEELAAAAVRP